MSRARLFGPVLALASVTILIPAAHGQTTWFVDDDNCPGPGSGTEADPFCLIQDCIDAAADGDECVVAPGTYFETINFNGKAITVRSSAGASVTTIDGTGLQNSVVTCKSGEGPDTALDGFTITNGSADSGGGMVVIGSSPTVTDCTFSGNFGNTYGGGMYNGEGSSPTVTNCTFSDNSTHLSGGGMYNDEGSSPTVTNCTFSGNSSVFPGGGMHNAGSSPTVTHCTFIGNSAALGGGGMFNSGSSPAVTNCTFSGNTGSRGGGIHNTSSSPTVTNCTFSGNSATYFGGGISNLGGGNPTLTNCTFSGNTAGVYGGGMYNGGSSPAVTNCTFNENTAFFFGGGMYNSASSRLTVTNCILWGNSPDEIGGVAMPTVSFSDVQGGWPGEGNINAVPLFALDALGCHYLSQTASGQAEDSPCVDAGDPDSPLIDGTTRTDHVADSGIVDMGFHHPPSGPQDVSDVCPPVIVHAEVIPGQTRPCSGYIDPRLESTDGVILDLGLAEVTLLFSQPVFSPGGGSVTPADFIVSQTGTGAPPAVAAVHADDNPLIAVTLDRIITLQEWTTIQAVVENAGGIPIRNFGNRGPGINEPDRLDVAFLPVDVNQDGTNSPFDLLTFRQYVNGLITPTCGPQTDYTDIDRDGYEKPFDLLRLRQLINGSGPSTRVWAGLSLNNPRP